MGQHGSVAADQTLARRLVGRALKDRVVFQQRVSRKIHLRDQPRREAGSEHAEMDMRRAPRIRRVAPGIGAGLDRHEAIGAVRAGHDLPGPGEIRVERRVVLIDRMVIAPGRVALPQFKQRPRHRPAVLVEHAPGHDDALAERLALVLCRQVGRVRPGPEIGETRPGRLGQRVLDADRSAARRALLRALIIGIEIGRLSARTRPGEGQEFGGHHRHLAMAGSACVSTASSGAARLVRLSRTRPLRSIPQRANSAEGAVAFLSPVLP
jgi:hypothetical protein